MEEQTYELFGSDKLLTDESIGTLQVMEGPVYVYISAAAASGMGRSFFLCECEEGDIIPVVDSTWKDNSRFHLLIVARDYALLEPYTGPDTPEEIEQTFYHKAGIEDKGEKGFSDDLMNWYFNCLSKEEQEISGIAREQNKVHESKLNLMASLFRDSKELNYDTDSDSELYNAMSIYCHYRDIDICSFQALQSCHGDNFTVFDIASLSHFVIRKVALEKEWYKEADEIILAFMKKDRQPIICIPRGKKYYSYDLRNQTHRVVDAEEASLIDADGYVAYEHLPGRKLALSEVLEFGLKHVNNGDVARFVIMYLFVTLLGLLLPYFHELFYDTLIPLGSIKGILEVGVVMFAIMSANIFFSLVQNLASYRGIKKMEYSLVAATYDRIFRLSQNFVEQFGTMELVNRTNAVPQVFSATVSTGVSASMGLILSLFYVWHMFDKSKSLAWRGVLVSIVSGIIMFYFGVRRIPSQREKQKHSTQANGMLYQMISGIMKLKVSGIENRSLYEFQKENTEALREDIKSTTISNYGNAINTVMQVIYIGLIYYTVVKKRADLSIGEYSSFMIAYGFFTSAVQQVTNFFLTMANLFPVIDRIRPIFEEEAETSEGCTVPGRLTGAIEVDHVSFTYEGEKERVLHNISMKINPGEYIGIVGPSGCGKSTLMKLLLGFEKPSRGKIYYDDKDLDTLDKSELRRQMGTVLQDGQLVMGTIMTNVTLTAPDLSIDQVEQVLKDAGIYDDIEEMPMGVYTNVSEGSGSISGGQRQRILIARALANNPRIVLFDEATSALDNITQQKVCESLESRHVTRIMIAHRLSTVKGCDRIYVLNQGEIAESGNFEELMEKKGLFYEFARRQTLNQMVQL